MPAYTLSQLAPMLDTYVEPNGDFKSSLNQVLSRIYNMGIYRDLTVQYSLPVVNGCVTLPDDADSVLLTMVDGFPVPVRSLWHDFKSVGIGNLSNNATTQWGLIDAGYTPTKQLFAAATANLYIESASGSGTTHTFSPSDGSTIEVIGSDGDQFYTGALLTTPYRINFSTPVTSIVSIRYDSLTGSFDLRTTALDSDTTIATVGPDSGVTRYRRFRINGAVDGETVVHVLCKRAFQPLYKDNQIVHVGNIGAIKHGLLGRLMEDAADIERAQYHWSQCMLLMEEEVNSSRGAAIPRLNIDPYGTGSQSRLFQLY
jgi:hypothetical protein